MPPQLVMPTIVVPVAKPLPDYQANYWANSAMFNIMGITALAAIFYFFYMVYLGRERASSDYKK